MLIFTSLLAFYLAWNIGANDVANAMATAVGSKAITLRRAIILAGVLEFTGAILLGQKVATTLTTKLIDPTAFVSIPQVLLLGMVTVLITCGIWLNLATFWGLPVSSTHAAVGAIAGFAIMAQGPHAVDWSLIGVISLTWMITPLVSGAIAALFYSQVKQWILDQPDPIERLREWVPWLSVAVLSLFGVISLPALSQPLQTLLATHSGYHLPSHTLSLALGTIAAVGLSLAVWQQLEQHLHASPLTVIEPFRNDAIAVTPGLLGVESVLARFQVVSACFVALAHGSNDVGNAIAPLATIAAIVQSAPSASEGLVLQAIPIPRWILVVGGTGIVAGLAIWGKRVIATIGNEITPLQPSGGFCAELATAATVLLASQLGLPVSTSHALVGGVVGVGLVRSLASVNWQTLRPIGLAWVVTVPLAALVAAVLFTVGRYLLPV